MKVISIIQPWATLIAVGEKRFETRSWNTNHRGELAIHASAKIDKAACMQEPIRSVLAEHGYTADNLPTGAIIAICNVVDCKEIIEVGARTAMLISSKVISGNEFSFGWYDRGRYAWDLGEVEELPGHIHIKGQQGLWNFPRKSSAEVKV